MNSCSPYCSFLLYQPGVSPNDFACAKYEKQLDPEIRRLQVCLTDTMLERGENREEAE